ncbi:MAG: helix-turn-helix domain-containing protein [Hyphomicrobium zavarzinii]|uniref:helix-turn-helix domain-containing protein n=1 Tax=Hyphomicrobium zavarzinii TaxID=48292 RepID=UPI001A3CB6F4|nr:helix-turn-helix domain-containing protein [Hyphomicrobium zavarzinii]MBL8845585.1 helix-turn-helix domain-containing protein [Hyphomicrobium zavarzinii]
MLHLPDPRRNPLLRESTIRRPTPPQLADSVARLERRAAFRERAYGMQDAVTGQLPARWFRPEPRPSVQYAGHMATTAARDHRLTPQSKALLQVLRARCGTGTRTETCKTTLAHIMGVTTRSIGRYVAELVRFGYIHARVRRGATGLYTGLVVSITEKVLPCFRKLTWLAGWLAHNLAAETGGNRDRTELSYKNHSHKEHSFSWASPADP